jgi:drug/metabolite transporter (DMT)-like permease
MMGNAIHLLWRGVNPINAKNFGAEPKWLFLRSFFGQTNQLLLIYAISLVPLYLFTIIWQTSPFFASVMGYCTNGELVSSLEWLAMLLCLAGVVLISHQTDS